ncbi:MAG: tetratricopeptide repeat protein [bacterium]|nr:tetratricopeptide repeat protein [bacterium]
MVVKLQSLVEVLAAGMVSFAVWASEVDEANRLFVFEKYEDAITIYRQTAGGESPKQAQEALFGMGRAYQMLGQWRSAKDTFSRLQQGHPDSELASGCLIQIGQCEVKLGNPAGALVVFEDIKKTYPRQDAAAEAAYHAANLKTAFFSHDAGSARAAIEDYNRVLESDLGKRYAVQSHFGLGRCYLMLGDRTHALNAFSTVIEKGPETVWASYAREQMSQAMRMFGTQQAMKVLKRQEELWADFERAFFAPLRENDASLSAFPGATPFLRIRAVGLFTESGNGGPGSETVVYLTPTIQYRDYVITSERSAVDRTRRVVTCLGNVRCMDRFVPPSLVVTSGAVRLNTRDNRAVFSGDVQLEKRAEGDTVQRITVRELHLLLDSGNIEIPGDSSVPHSPSGEGTSSSGGDSRTETLSK